MGLRLKQLLVVLVGTAVAVGMIALGLWQSSRYQISAEDVARERAELPSVPLDGHIHEDGTIDDVYGRSVTISGTWTDESIAVGTDMPLRVVQVLQMEDGRYVPVVLGTSSDTFHVELPDGVTEVEGIFTSSDPSVDGTPPDAAPDGSSTSLRLQALAQEWPSPLVGGYITLDAAQSEALGLSPAQAPLPEEQGSAMHQGYALQWWVFAGAVLVFSVVVARGMDHRPTRRTAA